MRIVNINNLEEISSLIIQKAKYQKVLLCIDKTSDFNVIQKLENKLSKQVVLLKYYFNKNTSSFFEQINDGVRIVIYNVNVEHFSLLQNDNIYILNIFLPTSNFILPYMMNCESVFGDNILFCGNEKDYLSVMIMYQAGLEKIWSDIQRNEQVDLKIFKQIDNLINNNDNFYNNLFECVNNLKFYISQDFFIVDKKELPCYIYLKMCYILKFLEKLNLDQEQYIDFYKSSNNVEEILKAYDLIVKYEFIDLIKYYCNNLMRVSEAILNRLKIIIKKFFNIKNIKLNKIKNIIKNQAKMLKIDNLLYISYIFDVI